MEEDLEELTRKMMEGMEGGEADQNEDLGECERNREWIEEDDDGRDGRMLVTGQPRCM